MSQRKQFNISEKNKSFLWLPPKTGTMHAHFIFHHFDFDTIGGPEFPMRVNFFQHNHSMHLFPGHENYKLICTARNPFTLFISEFKFFQLKEKQDFTRKNFQEFFSKISEGNFKQFFLQIEGRMPDYFLRIEHLYHDYIQIPFIQTSQLNRSGILYQLCQKKLNSTFETPESLQFYTSDMIDRVYEVGGKYMERLNYKFPH